MSEGEVCGALGCHRSDGLEAVTVDGRTRTLCLSCAKDFMGVSS